MAGKQDMKKSARTFLFAVPLAGNIHFFRWSWNRKPHQENATLSNLLRNYFQNLLVCLFPMKTNTTLRSFYSLLESSVPLEPWIFAENRDLSATTKD
jgi:hypothetical protein